MDFTPAPELVAEKTPLPDLVATSPALPRIAVLPEPAARRPEEVPPTTTPRASTPPPAAAPPPAATPPRASTPPPAATPPRATVPPHTATPPRAMVPPHAATPPRAAPPPDRVAFPTPHPAAAPYPGPPEMAGEIPDLTDEVDPQPAPAVWKQAHPSARRWAERRQGGAAVSSKRAPSLPRIVLGILVAALGAWLVLSFLPDRKPLNATERARVEKQAGIDSDAWRFGPVGYMAARGAAGLYLTIGVLVALRGLLYRRRLETDCRRCGRRVLAERKGLSLRCDTGQHATGVNGSALALVLAFAAVSLALAALIGASSLG